MTTLRWILGSILVLAGGGFLVLSVVAGGFRKSFGGSAVNPLVTLVPLAGMGLLLVALVFPGNRILLHTGAAAAMVLIGLCVWKIVREDASVLWFALLYLAAWLIFYGQATWG